MGTGGSECTVKGINILSDVLIRFIIDQYPLVYLASISSSNNSYFMYYRKVNYEPSNYLTVDPTFTITIGRYYANDIFFFVMSGTNLQNFKYPSSS